MNAVLIKGRVVEKPIVDLDDSDQVLVRLAALSAKLNNSHIIYKSYESWDNAHRESF